MITVFGLKCERQTGNISSCISASNYCNVSVYNSTFSMNNGSVLLVWNSRHLVVAHSSFFNNSTPAIAGDIYSYNSTIHVSHSVFYHNNAFYGGGASILKYSSGNVINCTFYNNSSPIYGGAIAIDAKSILNISHSTFLRNFGGLGGAVSATGSSLLFINCSFSENAAILPKDYYTNPIYKKYNLGAGGVIFIQDGVLKLFQSQLYNCFAHDIGGSVFSGWSTLSVHKTLFRNNFAGSLGGAIGILQNSSLTIEDSLLMNNSLLNKGNGGGLFIKVNSTLIMSNVHLIDNKATNGGAIYSTYACQITIFNSSFEGNTGSATWFEIDVLVQISNCQFLNNSASGQGAAIYVASSSVANLTDTVFSYNMADTMGGAFYIEKGADAYFHNCSFTFNSAYNGGALAAVKSDVHLTACNFIRNNAMKGGAFSINGTLYAIHCILVNNTAHLNGGVGYIGEDSNIKIKTAMFKANSALIYGGVFWIRQSIVNIDNSSFAYNWAGITSGVIDAQNTSIINICQATFSGNKANGGYGGVLIGRRSTKFFISDVKIQGNSAEKCGVMLIDTASVLQLNHSKSDDNNNKESSYGAFCIFNSSLFVAMDS